MAVCYKQQKHAAKCPGLLLFYPKQLFNNLAQAHDQKKFIMSFFCKTNITTCGRVQLAITT